MNSRLRRWLQPLASRLDRWERAILEIRSGDPLAERFAAFGRGTRVAFPPQDLGNVASVALGDDVIVRAGVTFEALAPPGKVIIRLGDRSLVALGSRFVAVNGIEIGADCVIGNNVTVADTIHDYKRSSRDSPGSAPLRLGRPLIVEEGAWIGNNCVITGGVTVGARSIVAPNTVITRDVPADTLVSGNPAHVQRRREPDGSWQWFVDPASLELVIPDAPFQPPA